ncbi:hypothetical protein BLL40_03155 [Domibacillus mangrovi]|uniref:Uncharacterized protein n=1 Tax=Domibacillus mangrovi TaxID=1714354 RepID=A0A1Q5P6D9_9BACI|nr:hypothetical protein BLL40_03155 [Domibacillus mangrovi]
MNTTLKGSVMRGRMTTFLIIFESADNLLLKKESGISNSDSFFVIFKKMSACMGEDLLLG